MYLGLGRGNRELQEISQRGAHDFHSTPNTIPVTALRLMRWTGQVARMVDRRGAYRVSVEGREGKKPRGTSMRRWKDNI